MQEYDLSFGKFIVHNEHLVEGIVHAGVDFDMTMVEEYHVFLRAHLTAPISVLVNKRNQYSYTFEAQQKIGTIPEIVRIAFVVYRGVSRTSTNSLISMPKESPWNTKVFSDYDEAMAWLNKEAELDS